MITLLLDSTQPVNACSNPLPDQHMVKSTDPLHGDLQQGEGEEGEVGWVWYSRRSNMHTWSSLHAD